MTPLQKKEQQLWKLIAKNNKLKKVRQKAASKFDKEAMDNADAAIAENDRQYNIIHEEMKPLLLEWAKTEEARNELV